MAIDPERIAQEAYGSLAESWPGNAWLKNTAELGRRKLSAHPHGDLPRWLAAIDRLPPGPPAFSEVGGLPHLGTRAEHQEALRSDLMELHPWRKGPLWLAGQEIDTEWRSDWKWERIRPHLDLSGKRVLDIGCGNGYFGYRMLSAGARLVVGVDPTLLFVMQFLAFRHFAGDLPNTVLPLGIEELPEGSAGFDLVFSMGVLYHRKDPLQHLRRIRSLLAPGGTMVLETLVLPESRRDEVLMPAGRYAAMRNVWAVPGTEHLKTWVGDSGFSSLRLVDVSVTTLAEQRSTGWMRFESLEQALDRDDHRLTREGHPAPVRAVLLAAA